MCWFVLAHLVALLVDLVGVRRRTDRDKDLQILLLQHQVLVGYQNSRFGPAAGKPADHPASGV